MSNLLYRLGRYAATKPGRVIGLWLLAALVVIGSSSAFGRTLEDVIDVPGLDSQTAYDLLSEAQSDAAGLSAQIVVTPADGGTLFNAESQADLATLHAGAAALPKVLFASDPATAIAQGPEAAAMSGAVSPDGTVAIIQLQYPLIGELGPDDLEVLNEYLEEAREDTSLRIEARGELFQTYSEAETSTGELIGLVAAVIILIVAFRSVIAMGLPIGIALFGLAIGITSMSLITYLIDIPSWAPQIASMVGLGVGIDYALFLVTRHREHLADGMAMDESIARSVATAGQAVVFAGGTVVIAILGLAFAGVPFMTAAGVSTSIVVLIMVVASITLLPALLGLAGHRIDKWTIGRSKVSSEVSPGWTRWGTHVANHAWKYAIGVTAVLLAMSAPVLSLQLGFPDDGSFPEARTERQAYDLVAEGFGPGTNGPLIVAVDLNTEGTGTSAGAVDLLEPLVIALNADVGIAAATPPTIDLDSGVASIIAFPTTSPQDETTLDTVKRLRSEVIPNTLGDSTVSAHVGGATASFADIGDRVTSRLPLFITAVIGLSFLLLMIVFRSVLVPLKAAILNLLSIGAAYGVLVMVFQWGWGKELIGLESTVPIVSFIPMFMFAILFGLSMDYEVFLLSRVREEYLRTGDNDSSVIHGIASTARVITSAALIMISVFGGFVLGSDPTIKMFGLGLATAIFVDATIVRIVLVPATMKLMGDTNWWLPGWLDKILPTLDLEGGPDMDAINTIDGHDETSTRELISV